MRYFRERVLEPILIPLAALVVIAFGVLNFSRLFLAAGGGQAVVVATLVSVLILGGAVVATSVDRIERGTLLAGAALVGLVLGGAGLVAQEVDLDAAAEHAPGPDVPVSSVVDVVAIDIDFPETAYEASPGFIQFNYENQGVTLHTLVVEGFEEGLGLEVGGQGDTDSGTIDLSEGDYVLYCDVPGHRAAGMEAELAVAEGLGTPPEGGGVSEGEGEDHGG